MARLLLNDACQKGRGAVEFDFPRLLALVYHNQALDLSAPPNNNFQLGYFACLPLLALPNVHVLKAVNYK